MKWPGIYDRREKIPTIIAIEGDVRNERTVWGAEVKPSMASSSWFKLGMASKSSYGPGDDPLLQQAVGKSLMRIPEGQTAQTLCKEFLSCLYKYIMGTLQDVYSPIFELTPIEFVFSTPAEWGEEYKMCLRMAATEAGFGSRINDKISMVDEPEAAALFTFEFYKEKGTKSIFQANKRVMVVDMGGGTVDLITYNVKSTSPFKVSEACPGTSAMCGGTTIDRELHRLLKAKYGNAFSSMSAKDISQGSVFMREFEDLKCRFGGESSSHSLFLQMDRNSGDGAEICGMFNRVLEPSIEKIMQQIAASEKGSRHPLQAIVLCGGLGSNPYILAKLKDFCENELKGKTQVIIPSDSWSAIATGAALSQTSRRFAIQDRICRWSYGILQHRQYIPGRDEGRETFNCPLKGRRTRGFLEWHIKKGQQMPSGFKWIDGYIALNSRRPLAGELQLYKCRKEIPPKTLCDDTVLLGTIQLDFAGRAKMVKRKINNEVHVQIGQVMRTNTGEVEIVARIGNRGKSFACAKFEYEAEAVEDLESSELVNEKYWSEEGKERSFKGGIQEEDEEEEDDDELENLE
ncbi:hypothetical protein LOZ35_005830, partial [Ophidiomyces ophidiicola]